MTEPLTDRYVPVVRTLPIGALLPMDVYAMFAPDSPCPSLLEGTERADNAPRRSFIAGRPRMLARFDAEGCTLRYPDRDPERIAETDPLAIVAADQIPVDRSGFADGELPAFVGGAIGYLGYECAAQWERLPVPERDTIGAPTALLTFVDEVIVFDPAAAVIQVIVGARITGGSDGVAELAAAGERADVLAARIEALREVPDGGAGIARHITLRPPLGAIESSMTQAEYEAGVERIQEHIRSGDVIQTVLSRRFSRPFTGDARELYGTLVSINPSPYSYLIEHDGLAVIGASPETIVTVHGRTVTTNPIAGTRPRGATDDEDQALVEELLADPKERAEHVMLVDLGRNDLARVCQPGSVTVDQMMEVERFSHVLHIVSTVTGELRDGLTGIDALRACFPAGTVSGAPKLRAMEIIADIEGRQRGIYSGAVGTIGCDGSVDMAIILRTIVLQDGMAHVQAGAGVVKDSVPRLEYEETAAKARAPLVALQNVEPQAPVPAMTDRELVS